ncbi:MAG: CehA/McbA family metallohydrolase domain-containing protein [Planctomycetota bacterium]
MSEGVLKTACRALGVAVLLAAAFPDGALPGEPLRPPRPGRLKVELFDYDSRKPTSALIRVTRAVFAGRAEDGEEGEEGEWIPVDGRASLRLGPGSYRLRVDGGRRRLPYDREFSLASGETVRRRIYVRRPAHLTFEKAGYVAVDPLYSAGGRPVSAALRVAEALELSGLGLDGLNPGRPVSDRRGAGLFSWSSAPDPRFGSKICLVSLPRRKSSAVVPVGLEAYADCGRPRRFNPWGSVVPWQPKLGRFYDLLASRPLATRGVAPRMYWDLVSGVPVGGFELDGSETSLKMWFALLAQGYRLPAVAGSRGRLSGGDLPEPRMMVRLPAQPPAGATLGEALLRAVAAGRSTLSFGPFCFLTVEGKGPGEQLPTAEVDRRVRIVAAASTDRRAEISRVEVYRDGKLLRRLDAPSGRTGVNAEIRVRQEEPGWFVARCFQRVRSERGEGFVGPETVAVTNPVWVEPETYSTLPKPVRTKVRVRIVDSRSGKPVPATVAPGSSSRVFKCPQGLFEAELRADERLAVGAPGYRSERVDIADAMGFEDFARKYAAMDPDEAARRLCDPGTLALLRQALRRCDVTVRLKRADR